MEKQLIFLHCFEFSLGDSKGLKSCISIHLFAEMAKYSGFTKASDLAVLEKGEQHNAPKHRSYSPQKPDIPMPKLAEFTATSAG